MKALDILKSSSNIEDRATQYVATIKRNLQKSFLDTLIDNIEQIEDKIQSQLDFTLDADLNKGVKPVSREETERRFAITLNLRYEHTLLKAELKVKQNLFDEYFCDEAK